MGKTSADLGLRILEHSRDALLVSLRFMEPAFSRLAFKAGEGPGYRTDGKRLFFGPGYVVARYAEDQGQPMRDYLHMVLHCVFRHQFAGETFSAPQWDLACDIAVESCIEDLGLPTLNTAASSAQRSVLARLRNTLPFITAETVYYHLMESGETLENLLAMREPFFVDDHGNWLRGTRRFAAESSDGEDIGRENLGEKPQDLGESAPETPENATLDQDDEASAGFSAVDDQLAQLLVKKAMDDGALEAHIQDAEGGFAAPDLVFASRPTDQEVRRVMPDEAFDRSLQTAWKEVSLKLDVALDDFAQLWGAHGGGFSMALKRSNLERVDYRDFLRRFVSQNESMEVNDDEFDYLFYCYGLELYGNMPLVEPLEYVDTGRIKDFVIAIDTSASTKGEVVESFLNRTYDILAGTDKFASSMNLYLVQCDAQIQDIAHIESREDLERYMEELQVKGLGGTDFRPVFAYVDDLLAEGKLANLKGLLYFTDGQGAFPRNKPRYDVAFVLSDEEALEDPDIPPWAMRVQLDTGQFHESNR